MTSCKTVYSKGKKRKAWNTGARKHFSNERREYLSETDKGSYCNQSEWLENKKIPDCTFFYGPRPSSTVLDIKANTTI